MNNLHANSELEFNSYSPIPVTDYIPYKVGGVAVSLLLGGMLVTSAATTKGILLLSSISVAAPPIAAVLGGLLLIIGIGLIVSLRKCSLALEDNLSKHNPALENNFSKHSPYSEDSLSRDGVDSEDSFHERRLDSNDILAREMLEKGIDIDHALISTLEQSLSYPNSDEIIWIQKDRNYVFRLKSYPKLIFKMSSPGTEDSMSKRFWNMIQATKTCLKNRLTHLVIPHAQKIEIEVKGRLVTLIVEEALDFEPNEKSQQELYYQHEKNLDQHVRELAIFIAETGFQDVCERNIPYMPTTGQIALIDLEDMGNARDGFIGGSNRSYGLIRCLPSQRLVDIAMEEARKKKIISERDLQIANRIRCSKMDSNALCRKFYEKNGIITGNERIELDLNSLELDLTAVEKITVVTPDGRGWEQQEMSLEDVVTKIIAEINHRIQENAKAITPLGKRAIFIGTLEGPLICYGWIQKNWLRTVLTRLVEKRYLFSIEMETEGYRIQA